MAAAPTGFLRQNEEGKMVVENTVTMLPRYPVEGVCRLCGELANLTKEHIPPKSSGNKFRHTNLTFEDWLNDRWGNASSNNGPVEQGGIFGYTLCKCCNSITGKLYGSEYMSWVSRAKALLGSYGPGAISQLNSTPGPFGENINFSSNGPEDAVKPGAFVRQILSCMCSLSGTWNLAGRYPAIRRIILEQATESLPAGMELGMYLYVGPKVRIVGPQLLIDMKTKTWRWVEEIAYPPYAFQFVIASNSPNPGMGLLIDPFTSVSPDAKMQFSGVIELGFGWSPYPGDYRSKAAIIAGRAKLT